MLKWKKELGEEKKKKQTGKTVMKKVQVEA